MNQPLESLCKKLDYTFKDTTLLEKALSHRSVGSNNNERLEFLGDAILGFVIAYELYHTFPEAREGDLSRYRASLVKGETLAILANELGLGEYLNLGLGELKSGGFRRDSILANTYEAIIGAIFLDGGMDAAKKFIIENCEHHISSITEKSTHKDPKTRLQEYLQARKLPLPDYKIVHIAGKSHEQQFNVRCKISTLDDPVTGEGPSRRKAEQDAAEKAIAILENDSSSN